jgi:hypothetical protein
MNEIKKTNVKKAGAGLGTIVGIIIIGVMLVTSIIPHPKLIDDEGTWHVIWEGSLASATENVSIGAAAGGFLEIFFVNHSAAPSTAYKFNTSTLYEGWADANMRAGTTGHAHSYNDSFKLQLKHSTLFDIVIKCRFNKTQCWNGTAFILSDTRVNITCAGFATMADIVGTSDDTGNSSANNFLWTVTYWQDNNGGTGTGFTLAKGAVAASNTILIKIWARY